MNGNGTLSTRDALIDTPRRRPDEGIWVFYLVFVILLFVEGSIVHTLGLWIGGAVFLFGGAALGLFELRSTKTNQRLRDPILRIGCRLQTNWGAAGYVLNAVITGGSPGVAVALKKLDHPRRVPLTLLAAVLFAVVWAPVWYFLWR